MRNIARVTITLLLLSLAMYAVARPQTRKVEREAVFNTSMTQTSRVIDLFARQFQSCPDSLFQWAYMNTDSEDGKHNELDHKGKDAVYLVYKDRTYNAAKREGDVAIDIYVLGTRMFRNNHLGSVYRTTMQGTTGIQQLNATYSGSLLEGGNIIFKLDSIAPNKTRVQYKFDMTFGKFFSGFVSDKTWKNVAEWRLIRIFANIKEYAETGKVKQM